MRRRSRAGLEAAAFLAILATACSGYKQEHLYPLAPAAPAARTLTVTLDQCGCSSCRVAVINPTTQISVFSSTALAVGHETTATTCYVDPTVDVTLECGDCPGPAACSAQLTVKAAGDAGEVALSPVLACTTAAAAGGQCQDYQRGIDLTTASTTRCST